MIVYPFFKTQNYRQNKISGFISVICFMERHKYCSFTITKKRSVTLEKGHLVCGFLKLKDFYRVVTFSWEETENELTRRMTPSPRSRTCASRGQYLMTKYQRFQVTDRPHNHNTMNATNSTPKNLLSSYSRTLIWKGLTHLTVVTLPVLRICICSTKPFRADKNSTSNDGKSFPVWSLKQASYPGSVMKAV